MNTELAKTLTTALVQFLDRERPEGTMCCSNTDCENIKGAFEEGEYDVVEAFIQKKLTRMTEFEKCLLDYAKARDEYEFDSTKVVELNQKVIELTKSYSKTLIAIAKKELCKDCILKEMDDNRVYKYGGPTPPTYWPPCLYGGECTNPFRDCINCHRQSADRINTITGTSTAKVEGKE